LTDRTRPLSIKHYDIHGFRDCSVHLLSEKPFEIFINGRKAYEVMATPGNEAEISAGLLFSAGYLDESFNFNGLVPENSRINYHIPGIDFNEKVIFVSSSCGPVSSGITEPGDCSDEDHVLHAADIFNMRTLLEEQQALYSITGASHGVAAFDANCRCLSFVEDMGRHNALDGVIGSLLMRKMLNEACFYFTTSRLSVEMAGKVINAGALLVAGVSAPTAMAVEMCRRSRVSVVGRLKESSFSVYAEGAVCIS